MFYIPNGFQHTQIFSKATLIWLILVLYKLTVKLMSGWTVWNDLALS